jgi:hypothetical protein
MKKIFEEHMDGRLDIDIIGKKILLVIEEKVFDVFYHYSLPKTF